MSRRSMTDIIAKYKATKMALSRKKFDIILDGKTLKINGNELLNFNKNILQQADLTPENMLKFNEFVLKINIELLKFNGKVLKFNNVENPQKTPFLSEKRGFSSENATLAPRVGGGVGGGGVPQNEVVTVPVSTDTYIHTYNKNFLKNEKTKKEIWKTIEKKFIPYFCSCHISFRKNFGEAKKFFSKIQNQIPEAWYFLGSMRIFWEKEWEAKYEKGFLNLDVLQVLKAEPWKSLSQTEIKKIVANEVSLKKELEKRIADFNGGKNGEI